MFILKQFLKALLLPPMPWLLMLLAVLIFWQRHWARKLLFLVTRDITKKWTMPPQDWARIRNQLAIRFAGRFPAD